MTLTKPYGRFSIPTTRQSVPLTRLTFSKVRSNNANLDIVAYQAHAGGLVPVDAALPRAEIAVAEVGICLGAFLGTLYRCQGLVPRDVSVVEQKRRGQMHSTKP
jgi:hypothetical protein